MKTNQTNVRAGSYRKVSAITTGFSLRRPGHLFRERMMDLVTGDKVKIIEPIWPSGPPSRTKRPIGEREFEAEIVKDSYGLQSGQHTFTLKITSGACFDIGSTIRRKGRTLYANVKYIISRAGDYEKRQELKHYRAEGHAARYMS